MLQCNRCLSAIWSGSDRVNSGLQVVLKNGMNDENLYFIQGCAKVGIDFSYEHKHAQ